MRDIEGKVAREAMSECGQRASFNISEFTLSIINVSSHVIGLDISQIINATVGRPTIQKGCSGKDKEKARMLKTRVDPVADALP
jgi:hypothetical protein